ncbi:MAG: glycosyltransferase [Victivallales bacterium]|nr:glycosyltransferase [Victivallales bacterium]
MNVFIIPSWCPSTDAPLSGSFFVEQARSIAQTRPDWKIALCLCDLVSARPPRNPLGWGRYMKNLLKIPRRQTHHHESGLIEYKIWKPYDILCQRKLADTVDHLIDAAEWALDQFSKLHGTPDIIHAMGGTPAGTAAVRLGRKRKIFVAITEHMGPFPWPVYQLPDGTPVPEIIEAYNQADICAAVSSHLAKKITDLKLADKVEVIPNFLDDNIFYPGKKREATGKCDFLSVGGPSHSKGTDVLLSAFAKLPVTSTLTIVGDSLEKKSWERFARKLNIASRVKWHGAVSREEMPLLYQACDVFVLPSRFESFGIVYLEALACGKPVVATRCGGPDDIVSDLNGILVPVNDVENLADAMRHMICYHIDYDPQILRADFTQRFSAKTVADRIEQWYGCVLENI